MSSEEGKVDYLYIDVRNIERPRTVFSNLFDCTDATLIRTMYNICKLLF